STLASAVEESALRLWSWSAGQGAASAVPQEAAPASPLARGCEAPVVAEAGATGPRITGGPSGTPTVPERAAASAGAPPPVARTGGGSGSAPRLGRWVTAGRPTIVESNARTGRSAPPPPVTGVL